MDSKWFCVKYKMGVSVSGFDGGLIWIERKMYIKRMYSKEIVWKKKGVLYKSEVN